VVPQAVLRKADNLRATEATIRIPITEAVEAIRTAAAVAGTTAAVVVNARSVAAEWGLAGRADLAADSSRAVRAAEAATARRAVGAAVVGIQE